MLLLFLLVIPMLAPFIKKAKWFGAEFEFKDHIEKAKKLVEQSEGRAKEKYGELLAQKPHFETFATSSARSLVAKDPNLALAALRIDMERVLSCAVGVIVPTKRTRPLTIFKSAKLLHEYGLISEEQADAIGTITNLCNKAVHGAAVTVAEATNILSLAERLNRSFPFGYSVNCFPNAEYKEQGLLCEWEHCIEQMRLSEEPTDLTCPTFGHDCPGGIASRKSCKKSANDLPPERFIGKIP